MWDHLLKYNQDCEKFSSVIPLRRMGKAIDVANAIFYLCSDKADFITGTELIVDGGILAGSAAAPSGQ